MELVHEPGLAAGQAAVLGGHLEMPAADWAERPAGDDLADGAGGEADQEQTGIFDRQLLDRETIHHRRDLDRAVAGERQQTVGRVPAGIDHLAAAHPLRIGTPGPGTLATAQLPGHGTATESAVLNGLDGADDEYSPQGSRGQQTARF